MIKADLPGQIPASGHGVRNDFQPEDTLKKHWGYKDFRPLQADIIRSVLARKPTLALLPTGGGKSICYQVPAMMMDGICIVVSPLISLMEDQVGALKNRGIKALAIHSFMTPKAIDAALDTAAYGGVKLLYVSPERIQTALFVERFKKMKVSFLAVDESHCISQWGHEFRPAYLQIAELKKYKEDLPMLALTATATSKVIEDIIRHLGIPEVQLFRQSFRRDNISFAVKKLENKADQLFRIIGKNSGTGIIYVRSRRKSREIAELLQNHSISADFYHAGLSHEDRFKRQLHWTQVENAVMVATNAFGMGIDKSNVRFVVHWDLPDSPEAFYQEAGRAGRDGKQSVSVILYDQADVRRSWQHYHNAYPKIEVIRSVYQHLCNHFQVARGVLPELALDFDLTAFCHRAGLGKSGCWNALKILEQEGFVMFSEGLYQPCRIQVVAGKRELGLFESRHPDVYAVVKYLLRAYSGILDQAVAIDLSAAVQKTGLNRQKLDARLKYLARLELISYTTSTSSPLLTFTRHIVNPSEIFFSQGFVERKDAHFIRTKTMIDYVENTTRCRNRIILDYFDETNNGNCGKCDICLIASKISGPLFERFKTELQSLLRKHKFLDKEAILREFPQYTEESVLAACRKLLEMEIIELSGTREFRLPA